MSEALFVETPDGEKLHIRHFPSTRQDSRPLLYIHGAIENGRIFYSEDGSGLAPYLAKEGLDGYVLDLRGRGKSTPSISRDSKHGQTELIQTDIPVVIEHILSLRPKGQKIGLIAHSWGGVLALSVLARYPALLERISDVVLFGTKRSVDVLNFERLIKISFGWNTLSPLITSFYGYLPARELNMGSDQETKKSHAHSKIWVKAVDRWIDPEDGFDYKAALATLSLPPLLSVMGTEDKALGHIKDAKRFLKESNAEHAEILEVPFGHIDMLTSKRANETVYPLVLKWLKLR